MRGVCRFFHFHHQLLHLLMDCFIPSMLTPAGCCAAPYDPSQTDDVRNCLYKALLSARRTAVDDWAGLEEFGKGHELAFRKATDLHILQEYLMDQWRELVVGSSVATVWESGKLACLHRFFKCRYNVDLTNAFATVGLYDPARPVPGTNIPTPN